MTFIPSSGDLFVVDIFNVELNGYLNITLLTLRSTIKTMKRQSFITHKTSVNVNISVYKSKC